MGLFVIGQQLDGLDVDSNFNPYSVMIFKVTKSSCDWLLPLLSATTVIIHNGLLLLG